jgi:hypothetical protein
MVSMIHPLINKPVQKWLGAIDSDAYQPAAPTKNHAFVKIEDMWSDPMDESEDKEEEAVPTLTIAEEPPVTRREPTTRCHALLQLYRAIYQSRHKLCFSRTSQMDKPQRPGTLSRSTSTKLTL